MRSKPKKKKRKDPRAKIEAKVYTDDGEMVFEGYVDSLELSRDFIETTASYDVTRTYIAGKQRFKLTGTVEPWKDEEHDRSLR